jgi:hypothetical protein
MERRYIYIYEDDYLPILECRRTHFYELEIKKLRSRFIKERRMMKWKKNAEWVKKRYIIKMKEKLKFQRSVYRQQFCQDNKFIFSKKTWKYLKKHEIHLYQKGKRILFNNKTWNLINKKGGITVDWKSFNKIWNNKFLIQSFMGTIDSYRCREYYT